MEQQLKTRGIPWTSVFSAKERKTDNHPGEATTSGAHPLSPFSSTARSVPKICIRISDTVRSERAANVAYENVKIKVVDWWSERPCRVGINTPTSGCHVSDRLSLDRWLQAFGSARFNSWQRTLLKSRKNSLSTQPGTLHIILQLPS